MRFAPQDASSIIVGGVHDVANRRAIARRFHD
jgi:hypothetical protein